MHGCGPLALARPATHPPTTLSCPDRSPVRAPPIASAADGSAWRLAVRKRAAAASTDGSDDDDDGASAVVTEAYANLSRALLPSTGAGAVGLAWRPVDYSRERLSTEGSARAALGVALARVAVALEAALGGPQDVEGCVSEEGDVVVVQSRPQPGAG